MNKTTVSALALAPTIVALSLGAAVVPANAHPHHDDAGWYPFEATTTYEKGEVCSGRVVEHYESTERILVESEDGDLEPLTPEDAAEFDPTTLENGQRWAVETREGTVRWSAPRTHRHVTRDSSGDLYFKVVGGNDFVFKGFGNNFYVGPGVKGILQTSGKQKGFIEDFDDPDTNGTVTLKKVKGKTEQICHKLGLRAVQN